MEEAQNMHLKYCAVPTLSTLVDFSHVSPWTILVAHASSDLQFVKPDPKVDKPKEIGHRVAALYQTLIMVGPRASMRKH